MKGLHAEEYHYTAMGRVTSKTMKVTRKYPSNPDLPEPKELTASMAMTYSYNSGRAAQTTYPTTFSQAIPNTPWSTVVGPRFEYSYDVMNRVSGETKADWTGGSYGTPASIVSGITYNFNSQLTGITFPGTGGTSFTETRQYNTLLQLSRLTIPGVIDEEYKYSTTQNDGRLTGLKNWGSGEEVVYQYDSLQRLSSAVTVGPEWGMSWVYDGFGNRTAQNVVKGTVPVQGIAVDMNTNRVTSWTYDSNGNATSIPGVGTITYDASNRVKTVGGETYEYDPSNKRTWKNDTFTFWGGRGERVGTYSVTLMSDTTGSPTQWKLAFVKQTEDWYFGGRRLNQIQDRLGSERSGGKAYYPYGEERTATANPADKFATYHRDGTGLDYADQRYYASGSGRFVTVDPLDRSASSKDPVTFNRFSYGNADPILHTDPTGLSAITEFGAAGTVIGTNHDCQGEQRVAGTYICTTGGGAPPIRGTVFGNVDMNQHNALVYAAFFGSSSFTAETAATMQAIFGFSSVSIVSVTAFGETTTFINATPIWGGTSGPSPEQRHQMDRMGGLNVTVGCVFTNPTPISCPIPTAPVGLALVASYTANQSTACLGGGAGIATAGPIASVGPLFPLGGQTLGSALGGAGWNVSYTQAIIGIFGIGAQTGGPITSSFPFFGVPSYVGWQVGTGGMSATVGGTGCWSSIP